MFNQILHRLEGQVLIRVETAFPERVLNLCGARNLSFWDLEWESPAAFTCRLSRRDYHALRRAAKNLDCTLTLRRREGAPFFLLRFRRRHLLLAGLGVCAAALFVGSFFIWEFTVDGNAGVPDETILRALERNGVGLGTFSFAVDQEELRNHILLEIPELSWITVNVSGSRAYVQARERTPPPERADKRVPANVVARRDGLVLKVRALDGRAQVLPGTTVRQGQLLISGVEDTDTFGARLMAGTGTVTARTWYQLSAVMPLTVEQKSYTGGEKTGWSVLLGSRRIKFFSNSSIEGATYDKITHKTHWSLFGLPLPITTVRETYRFYETVPVQRSPEEAERRAETVLTENLRGLLDGAGTVSSTLCTAHQRDGALSVTLSAECVEQIGESVPIYQ